MSDGYQIKNQEGLYFLTFQVVGWADIFSRKVYRDIVINSFDYSRKNKSLELFSYVIMTNHIHLIARSKNSDLSGTVRDIKKHISKQVFKTINDIQESRREWLEIIFKYHAKHNKRNLRMQFWTHENHAVELTTNKMIEERINYIHKNPVRAGLVLNEEDYLYSSAKNFAEMENLLQIDKI